MDQLKMQRNSRGICSNLFMRTVVTQLHHLKSGVCIHPSDTSGMVAEEYVSFIACPVTAHLSGQVKRCFSLQITNGVLSF